MAKKVTWAIIFATLIVNVVILQQTVEAYFGQEHEIVFRNTIIGIISSLVALCTYFAWRKMEYKK